jgi:hypothetical protein
MDEMSDLALIREFFSVPGRVVTTAELEALTAEDRKQLGASIAEHLAQKDAEEVTAA